MKGHGKNWHTSILSAGEVDETIHNICLIKILLFRALWNISTKHYEFPLHYSVCLFKYIEKVAIVLVKQTFNQGWVSFKLKTDKHVHSCTCSAFKEMDYLHWHLNKELKCMHNPFQLVPCSKAPLKACICAQCTDFSSVYTSKLQIETKQDKNHINVALYLVSITCCFIWTWHWFYGHVISKPTSFMADIRNILRHTEV